MSNAQIFHSGTARIKSPIFQTAKLSSLSKFQLGFHSHSVRKLILTSLADTSQFSVFSLTSLLPISLPRLLTAKFNYNSL